MKYYHGALRDRLHAVDYIDIRKHEMCGLSTIKKKAKHEVPGTSFTTNVTVTVTVIVHCPLPRNWLFVS